MLREGMGVAGGSETVGYRRLWCIFGKNCHALSISLVRCGPCFSAGMPSQVEGRDPSRTWVKGKHEVRCSCSKHSLFAFMNNLLEMFHCSPTSSLRLLSLRRVSNGSPCLSGSGPRAAEASAVSADLNCLEAITSATSVQSPVLTIRVHTTACIFVPDPSLRCGDVK